MLTQAPCPFRQEHFLSLLNLELAIDFYKGAFMAIKLKPLSDRILVKRIDGEERTKGGIIIPDSAKEKPMEGEVVATGPGRTLDNGQLKPMTVKVSDHVLFAKYAETEVKLDGASYLLLREDDVLGILA
jgi:chaperonin GroES